MLSIQSIQLMAGAKVLLNNASLVLHPGQKVGLIGANGAGKTTLFKAIMKQVSVEAGNIDMPDSWLVGYVSQEIETPHLTALAYVESGDSLYSAVREAITQAELAQDHEALVAAYDRMDVIDGYQVPVKAQQLLFGLGFSAEDLKKPVQDFSGGWQVRLKLAAALMQRADLLLLDEPTNHLDIEAVSWLLQWLSGYSGAVMVISHDRHFLDEVVGGIVQIDQGKLNYYAGNFASYERQRNAQLLQQQAMHEKQKLQMQHLKSFIDRFKAKASKAKQAQSRVKALNRMEEVAAVQACNPFLFEFGKPEQLPDPMLQTEQLTFAYPNQANIIENVKLVLRAGDRIGLVGINGSGKSTLLKLLVGDLTPISGKVRCSKGVKIGYFAQHQLEALYVDLSPLQHMLKMFGTITDQAARNFLGQFGFSNEQSLTPVKTFSGGEKARLSLALIIYQNPNLIILDEPTNHLDMETRDALDLALQSFEGAVILVSHDQHLLSSIVDQYWWVHQANVAFLHGSLEDYLQERLKLLKAQQQIEKAEKIAEAGSKSTRPGDLLAENAPVVNKKAQRQESAQLRKAIQVATQALSKKLTQVEKNLAQAQQALLTIHQQMASSDLYEAANSAQLAEVLKTEVQLTQTIEQLEEEWLMLETEIDETTQAIQQQNGL